MEPDSHPCSFPGVADAAPARGPHRPPARAGCAPSLPAPGQGLHTDAALPAALGRPAGGEPGRAHVRGQTGALLPGVRLQPRGPLRHHPGPARLHGAPVLHERPRVPASEQWLLSPAPCPPGCRPKAPTATCWGCGEAGWGSHPAPGSPSLPSPGCLPNGAGGGAGLGTGDSRCPWTASVTPSFSGTKGGPSGQTASFSPASGIPLLILGPGIGGSWAQGSAGVISQLPPWVPHPLPQIPRIFFPLIKSCAAYPPRWLPVWGEGCG